MDPDGLLEEPPELFEDPESQFMETNPRNK
jgi:hypothetical protein